MSLLASNSAVQSFLLVYAALFSIVNPVGGAPVFLSLTRHLPAAVRHGLAGRVALNGFLLLLGSLFIGSHVLEFFGLTLPVVRVAGGLVVTWAGWGLLNQQPQSGSNADLAAASPAEVPDAFYPLTMPITVGPGSMTVAITLGSRRPQVADITEMGQIAGGALAGLVAIAVTIYVCYRSADVLERMLGKTGTNVLLRLSAFILLCIGVEIMWDGVSALMHLGDVGLKS